MTWYKPYAVYILMVVVLVAISFALYGRTLGFEYVWDDSLLFLDKTDLLNKPLSWGLLTQPVLEGTSYMRPLVFLSFYAEFQLIGQQSWLSHLINLMCLSINSILIFGIVLLIGRRKYGRGTPLSALVASVLYIVHPAMIESTAWVSGRFDQFATLFILLAVLIYLVCFRSLWIKVALICICTMASLLSKELGIITPGILACVWFASRPEGCKSTFASSLAEFFSKNFWLLALLALTVFFYMLLRKQAMGGIYHESLTMTYWKSSILDMDLPLEALRLYFSQSLFPFKSISPYHPVDELVLGNAIDLALNGVALFSVVGLIYSAARWSSPASWLAIAYLIGLVPVLHFIPLSIGGNLGHERFLTAPLAFLCMSIVFIQFENIFEWLGVRFMAVRGALIVLLFGWIGVSIICVAGVLPFWSNELQLWNWAYSLHQEFEPARYNYIYGALKSGRDDIAEKEIERIQSKYGGLDVGEQILYANSLIRTGRPEGLKYLEGVTYALPKFHLMPDGREHISDVPLSAMHIAGAYVDYASGLLMYEGNAQEALKYNEIAKWYAAGGEQIPISLQRVAILYALGDFAEADMLYRQQVSLKYYRMSETDAAMRKLLRKFCEYKGESAEPCSTATVKGIINP